MILMSRERGNKAQVEASALKWAVKENFPWLTVFAYDRQLGFLADLKTRFVPTYILVDKDGKELLRGENEIFEKIKSL